MFEWLAAVTGIELGKLVLEQVLNLGKAAMEDYVKDFFKSCIQNGVAQAAAKLKRPMAEAIGYFIKLFIKELQINGVPETSIDHHYLAVIKRFVQDKAVRPILGKAFEKDCRNIDYTELAAIWTHKYQVGGWRFPEEEFDWRRVGKEYVYEVKGIVKANEELRSLLEVELLENIANDIAPRISPGFDVIRYRESLQYSYNYLKLYILEEADKVDEIKLWNMFIEQSVRAALPPMRYELPLDLKRKLQEQGQLEEDLPPEFLEYFRVEYFRQPSSKVLKVLADSRKSVILGDPGAGKSSLLQYLTLDWVERKTGELPLLIELREYAVSQSSNFLEFFEHGKGADWHFDQKELHQYLLDEQTLVMFDGLDEVIDIAARFIVRDDIIRFSQQYEKARIIVTSRITGYNPERFQNAQFRHYTIQPLDTFEVEEFIERWYNLTMVSDPNKHRFEMRLKNAIASSDAIRDLADNPMLLTMMAILNKRQDLPRDRVDLYDQASRVLLYHWDVDYKGLQVSPDAIGRREKQEMLRLIAYEMQNTNQGLKTNLISAEQLTRVLTNYLHSERFSDPREKANQLIKQLQERNFILCYRGIDSYGFIHRTFLEYFCALEIVNRFESQKSISFEELRWQTFKLKWIDETWHEVLKLICGMVNPHFAEHLIAFLLDIHWLKDLRCNYYYPSQIFEGKEIIANLLLAAGCLNEINKRSGVEDFANKLLGILQKEVLVKSHLYVSNQYLEVILALTNAIATVWAGDHSVLMWFKELLLDPPNSVIESASIIAVAKGWSNDVEAFELIKSKALTSNPVNVQLAIIQSLSQVWKEDPHALQLLLNVWVLPSIEDTDTRTSAVQALAQGWRDNEMVFALLKKLVTEDENILVRISVIEGLGLYWKNKQQVFNLLTDLAQSIESFRGCLKNSPESLPAEALGNEQEVLINKPLITGSSQIFDYPFSVIYAAQIELDRYIYKKNRSGEYE